jgi:hypothetical protein
LIFFNCAVYPRRFPIEFLLRSPSEALCGKSVIDAPAGCQDEGSDDKHGNDADAEDQGFRHSLTELAQHHERGDKGCCSHPVLGQVVLVVLQQHQDADAIEQASRCETKPSYDKDQVADAERGQRL